MHDRVPVVLEPKAYDAWLAPDTEATTPLPWLRPWQDDLKIEPVTL